MRHLAHRSADGGRAAVAGVAQLRQAVPADIPAMHRIRLAVRENVLSSRAITEDDYLAEMQVTGRGWVVVADGQVVAFAVGNRHTANIWALFVAPGHEGKGYGRSLLDATVDWLFAEGVSRIWLGTEPGTRAQKFYEAAGWVFCGELPGGERCYELQRP